MILNVIKKNKMITSVYFLWISLGYYRGIEFYDYKLKQNKENTKIYTKIFINRCYGSFVYGNPLLFPYIGFYEIMNLECYLRNIDKKINILI